MRDKENTIYSDRFLDVKQILDGKKSLAEIELLEKPRIICALFLAIKESKYRDKALDTLSSIIFSYSFEKVYKYLKDPEIKKFKINSYELSTYRRNKVIQFLFLNLTKEIRREAVLLCLGFFLTPASIPLIKKFSESDNPIIRDEANYSLSFLIEHK